MKHSSNDTPSGRSGAGPRIARKHEAAGQPRGLEGGKSTRRWNIGRDAAGALLLVVALIFPWNLYFGIGIPNSDRAVWALPIIATVLSVGSIAVSYAGHFDPARASGLRLGLNVPYLLLVIAFVAFNVVQSIRDGGTVNVPGGAGPGAWLGVAGSLLSAQPVISGTAEDDGRFHRWLVFAQVWGYAAIAGAWAGFIFNLSWRVRYALNNSPGSDGSAGFGGQNVAVIATAAVYGVAALAAVMVASRWLLRSTMDARLVTIALGASTLLAGVLVWSLPIGRELDAFHGIAQNTSTAGVGYEGYLAWVAAAAIFAPLTLRMFSATRPIDTGVLRLAARKGLLIIVVWCFASMAMRITDLAVEVSLDFPYSRYDSVALAVFDLATAVLALWLRANLINRSMPVRLVRALCGFLFALTISRLMVGVSLAPRFAGSARTGGPVYGNNLAQQITSTFDVVLCGLALCILVMTILASGPNGRLRRHRPRARLRPSGSRATASLSGGATPRIFRPDDSR